MTKPEQVDRYEIKNELGRGGMATVYEAYDPRFQRPVAVKVLPREFMHDPEFQARFTREARTIAALEHPAIVPVYDFGESDGQPYLVMRLMDGGSLLERLENGPIDIEEASDILKRIGSALDRAHRQGIVHRDLKPGNILFDQYGDAYLADFGIVRVSSSNSDLTASGSLVGTPTYMSPEQVYGDKELDGRADIYALGVILYQMLTGEIPYAADTPARMMMAHVMDPVPHVLDIRPDLPPDCDTVVTTAMAKERDKRFATASDMTTALSDATERTDRAELPASFAATLAAAEPGKVSSAPPPTEIAAEPEADLVATAVNEDEPYYDEPVSDAAGGGTKIPVWVWVGLVVLGLFCFAGTAGAGILFLRALEEAEPTTGPVAGPSEDTGTDVAVVGNGAGAEDVFESFDETVTPASAETATSTTSEATATPAGAEVALTEAESALATRQALENSRAGAGTDSGGEDGSGALATRESLEATRAAEGDDNGSDGGDDDSLADNTDSGFGELDDVPPLFGPVIGALAHEPGDNTVEMFYPGIAPQNFILNAEIISPFAVEEGSWDFGVAFRQSEPDEEYRIVVRSDGFWNLNNRHATGEVDEFLQEGSLLNYLDLGEDEANQLTLIVYDDTGYFFLNEAFVAILNLTARNEAGDIALGTGFYTADEQDGAVTEYEAFTIWPLQPTFGPESGELVHAIDDFIKLDEAGIDSENVLLSATFRNPFASERSDWDLGFSFRDDDDGTKYWLVLNSEGFYELVARFGEADSDTVVNDGDLTNLNLGEGERNDVALIALGETGFFFVNGELMDTLDLFDITASGDAEIFTAYGIEHEIEGEATGYEDFVALPLP